MEAGRATVEVETRFPRRHRRVLQLLEIIHLVLRGLNRHVIAHTVLRIQPEIRRRLETGGERHQHVVGHVARLHSHVLRARPVDVHVHRRPIEGLLHVHIGGAWNVAYFVR
jgi:hypothetical protein